MPNFWSLGCIVVIFYCCEEPDIHSDIQFPEADYVADGFLWHLSFFGCPIVEHFSV